MSQAAVQSLFIPDGGALGSITVGQGITSDFPAGYDSLAGSPYGSLSVATVNGQTITKMRSQDLGDLEIRISATPLAQNFFRGILIQDGAGVWRQYLTAEADDFLTSTVPDRTVWIWGLTGASRVYAQSDATEVHSYILLR